MSKSKFKRHNNIHHCRYCDIETKNKNRICDEHKNTRECKRCKKRVNKNNYQIGKQVCNQCLEEEKTVKQQEKLKRHTVNAVCKCGRQETVVRRYKDKPKNYTCTVCKKEHDEVEGNLVQCPTCKTDFELISAGHMKKCCKMTYKEFLEKYGREAIYSERYSNRIILANLKVDKQKLHDKMSESLKEYHRNNKEVVLERMKNAQNSDRAKENHKKGFLKYLENITEEQTQQRKDSAVKSWQNPETRRKRIESINSPKSIAARSAGAKKAAFIVQRNYPKITKPMLKVFEALKSKNVNCVLEYEYRYYHIDIAIPELKIAIEIDGDYWHGNEKYYKILTKNQKDRKSRDLARNTYLKNRHWSVLRFWTSDIDNNLEKIVFEIENKIEELKCLTKIS
jgi:very-short-patch-repair endonuclease